MNEEWTASGIHGSINRTAEPLPGAPTCVTARVVIPHASLARRGFLRAETRIVLNCLLDGLFHLGFVVVRVRVDARELLHER